MLLKLYYFFTAKVDFEKIKLLSTQFPNLQKELPYLKPPQ